jgi:hypothetical protein
MKKNNDLNFEQKIKNRNSWLVVISVCFFLLLLGICIIYYVFSGEKLNLDVPTILSTLLAFFSIYLSAVFYFKATEQSNQFYESSYNHNKNIAESLSGMKGEFGKSLDMIEKQSDGISKRIDNIPWERIGEKKKQINEVKQEAESSLKELLHEMGIGEERQAELLNLIKKQETHIEKLKNQIYSLENNSPTIYNRYEKDWEIQTAIDNFIHHYDLNNKKDLSVENLNELFKEYLKQETNEIINLLLSENLINTSKDLTKKGIKYIKDHIEFERIWDEF